MVKKIKKSTNKKPVKVAAKSVQKSNIIKLKELMDISYAEKFHNEMLSYINSASGDLFFDASDVSRITTPCVQIIIAAEKEASENNIKIIFSEVSQAFEKSFSDLGLTENLSKLKG